MGRRVLLALLSAAVLVGLMAQPGAAVNLPSLVKLRLSDGARITALKGKTNAGVKDMAVSGGRLSIGGTFKTAHHGPRVPGRQPARRPVPPRHRRRHDPPRLHRRVAGAPSTVTTGVDWSTVRGAFLVSDRLYTGHADGTMTVCDFDGTTAGFNGLTSTQFPVTRITGMFFWNGRLYYRWLTPESGVLGADTFVASGAGDGRNRSTVSGMTMASVASSTPPPPAPCPRWTSRAASPPGPPPSSAAPPSTASPGSPEACSSSDRHPVRYPAPRQPL